MLIKQKYRLLFSPKRVRRPGPKGPTKRVDRCGNRNETAQLHLGLQAHRPANRLGIRRGHRQGCGPPDSTRHFHPEAGSAGPSWLSLIGNAKDSLWSLDLFRCESAILRSYWVLVVMDQFT